MSKRRAKYKETPDEINNGVKFQLRNEWQSELVDKIRKNDVVFAVGKPGSGKSFIAASMALHYFFMGKVKKIVLVRPAVEACGENLGFLPGGLLEKVSPYMEPLFDVIEEHIGKVRMEEMIAQGVIKLSPVGFMRGITLKDSFVVIDEAQGLTSEAMEMVLSRFGENTKYVICGDPTQSDLRKKETSGLLEAVSMFSDCPNVGIVELPEAAIVRHPFVREVASRYAGKRKMLEETKGEGKNKETKAA